MQASVLYFNGISESLCIQDWAYVILYFFMSPASPQYLFILLIYSAETTISPSAAFPVGMSHAHACLHTYTILHMRVLISGKHITPGKWLVSTHILQALQAFSAVDVNMFCRSTSLFIHVSSFVSSSVYLGKMIKNSASCHTYHPIAYGALQLSTPSTPLSVPVTARRGSFR